MDKPSTSRGRGALLEKLREKAAGGDVSQKPSRRDILVKLQEKATLGQAAGVSKEPEQPTIARGRAAMLSKLRDLKIGAPAVEKPATVERTRSPEEVMHPEQVICEYTGTAGKQIKLTANYLKLHIQENMGVFEYDVSFDRIVDSKNIRIKILNANLQKLGGVKSFDGGTCLYLPIKLPDTITLIQTTHPIDNNPITMQVRYHKQKHLYECMHLFNTMFKRIMRALLMVEFRRGDYFDLKAAIMIPQYKLQVLPGYAITCNEFKGGLLLMLDTQHRVLRTQTVLDLMKDLRQVAGPNFREEATKMLLGASVMTNYNSKNYTVDDVVWTASPADTFMNSKGEEMTYVDYYKAQYNIDIRWTNPPMLLNKQKLRRGGQAGEERMIYLVPELCNMTGLTDAMRSDFKVMKSISEHTRLTPGQRLHAIQSYVKRVRSNPEATKILADWGMSIAEGTIDMDGRLLNLETIYFGNNRSSMVGPKVDWTGDMSKNAVVLGVDLIKWVLIFAPRNEG